MIRAGINSVGVDPAGAPVLIVDYSEAAPLTAVVVMSPIPPPAYAVVTGVIVQREVSDPCDATGIIKARDTLALQIINADQVSGGLGSPVRHELIEYVP